MSRPHLELVKPADRAAPVEQGCISCALFVMFLITGLIWWPFFYWMYH